MTHDLSMSEYRMLLQQREAERDRAPTAGELELRLGKCGVPEQLLADLRKPLVATDSLRAAREFSLATVDAARCLFLLGPVGGGKSVAAAWLVRKCLEANAAGWNSGATGSPLYPALWVSAGRLTRLSSYDKLDTQWLDELYRVRVLVLDDAGDEGSRDGLEAFRGLLLERFAKRRRTVVTSNLKRQAFRARYGDAVLDRAESAGLVVEVTTKSMRVKRQEAHA